MTYTVTVEPGNRILKAAHGQPLLELLRSEGLYVDAPCGGNGTCGKCLVTVNGKLLRACGCRVEADVTVTLPGETGLEQEAQVKPSGSSAPGSYVMAVDIGTTGVVCSLLSEDGKVLAEQSAANPQRAFGADVVSRIRQAVGGEGALLTEAIRSCVAQLADSCCKAAGIDPGQVKTVCPVGNPCMQQLFLGMDVKNLAAVPFSPVICSQGWLPAEAYIPGFCNGQLRVIPNIGGFIGSDTLACVLAAELTRAEDTVLLVDIGTNAEMVLRHKGKMAACAAAAGPALEGANISCGMRAQSGAVSRVDKDGCCVIGGGEAKGICGSGLIDAVALMLERGILDSRGRLLTEDKTYTVTAGVTLTQEDIRQVQLAKGAVHAGIRLLAEHMGIGVEDIDRCVLAGAFGSYLNGENACRMGLIPHELVHRTAAAGNLALAGAKKLALGESCPATETIESLELGSLPGFARQFARSMRFQEETILAQARLCGFTEAAALNVRSLIPREDVRQMCAADRCGAYGKNWTCPPYCGSLEVCRERLEGYSRGVLLQTVGHLEKTVDTKGYARAEQAHLEAFHRFARWIRREYPNALCLGAGGCRICEKCAWPEPCRFPEEACPSMESYGLFVTQVCRDNGLAYHHGARTVTYTACVLF